MRQPLNLATFHILLALATRERHGYDIMRQTGLDSQQRVKLGPATLYTTIKKLLGESLIEEAEDRPDPALDDSRRRYYRLTARGRAALGAELERMDHLVELGRGYGITHSRLAP